MKAHVIQTQPLMLLYRLEDTAAQKVLQGLGFATAVLAPAQLLQTVGSLAAGKPCAETLYDEPAPEMGALVMCHVSQPHMNLVLDTLRTKGIVIPLKAVLTQHNESWTALTLLRELAREKAEWEAPKTAQASLETAVMAATEAVK